MFKALAFLSLIGLLVIEGGTLQFYVAALIFVISVVVSIYLETRGGCVYNG